MGKRSLDRVLYSDFSFANYILFLGGVGILSSQLKTNSSATKSIKDKQEEILEQLLQIMNGTYKQIDPTGNLDFDSLFTKRDETYSGSETTMFHLAKLYSI